MGRKKRGKIPPYLLPDPDSYSGNFAMIPPELYESEAFQELGHAARNFLILLAVHSSSAEQKKCLYRTLEEYNELGEMGYTDDDIKFLTWGNRRTHTATPLFVIPAKHLKAYGYSPQYANELKNELIKNGFIKVVMGGKGKSMGWSKNVTIYAFCNDWKANCS